MGLVSDSTLILPIPYYLMVDHGQSDVNGRKLAEETINLRY